MCIIYFGMDSNKGEDMSWRKRGMALAVTLVLTVSTSVVMGAPAQQVINSRGRQRSTAAQAVRR